MACPAAARVSRIRVRLCGPGGCLLVRAPGRSGSCGGGERLVGRKLRPVLLVRDPAPVTGRPVRTGFIPAVTGHPGSGFPALPAPGLGPLLRPDPAARILVMLVAARGRQHAARLIVPCFAEIRLMVSQPVTLGWNAAGRIPSGHPAAQVTAARSVPSGRTGRAVGALFGSHGPDTEEYDHEDHEHDHYQASHEEKHSHHPTRHGRTVGTSEAHAATGRGPSPYRQHPGYIQGWSPQPPILAHRYGRCPGIAKNLNNPVYATKLIDYVMK